MLKDFLLRRAAGKGGGGAQSWNDLKDRPFGETEGYILPETIVSMIEGEGTITGVEFSLTVGEEYTVNWNGTDYKCTAHAYGDGTTDVAAAVGNIGLLTGGESTGEPFVIIAVFPEYVSQTGGVTNMVLNTDGSTGDIPVSIKGKTLAYIDSKYIENMYYTESSVKTLISIVTVAANNSVELDASLPLIEGNVYTVAFNGTNYECTAMNYNNLIYLGNLSLVGGDIDTGEPFFVVVTGEQTVIGHNQTEDATISVSGMVTTVHQVPKEYIPDTFATKDYVSKVASSTGHTHTISEITDYTPVVVDTYLSTTSINPVQNKVIENSIAGRKTTGRVFIIDGVEVTAKEGAEVFNSVTNKASGEDSHAEGAGTIASGESQHVQGKYNVEDISNKYAHIVGNGNYTKQSNAYTLDWDGNAWFAGGVELNSPNGTRYRITVADDGTLTATEVTE